MSSGIRPKRRSNIRLRLRWTLWGNRMRGACYYRITRCPICAYAERLGVRELMPLFCELDEVMIQLWHGILHRKQTLANGGEYCDYFITGNKE